MAGEGADLVGPRGIPGFGNELRLPQYRVFRDLGKQGRVSHDRAVLVASHDGGEVEAEPVHVHLHHPVGKAVDDELAHNGVVAIDRIAASRIIPVAAPVLFEHVVDRVVEAAERYGRSKLVALGRVVEDDVENDLDAGLMQLLYHPFELLAPVRLPPTLRIGRLRRKEGDGAVAPVVCERLAGQRVELLRFPLVEFLDREELDRGNPQFLKVRDFFDDAAEGAGRFYARRGVYGQPPDVGFIDDGLRPRRLWRRVFLPVEAVARHDAPGHGI